MELKFLALEKTSLETLCVLLALGPNLYKETCRWKHGDTEGEEDNTQYLKVDYKLFISNLAWDLCLENQFPYKLSSSAVGKRKVK